MADKVALGYVLLILRFTREGYRISASLSQLTVQLMDETSLRDGGSTLTLRESKSGPQ
jgi:hypothetical protein